MDGTAAFHRFGLAAVLAARDCLDGRAPSPAAAWARAVATVFPERPANRRKSCPRRAFIGLCEAGAVRGIPPAEHPVGGRNARYALAALAMLHREPQHTLTPGMLWQRVMAGAALTHNQQMDVVLGLWRAGLLAAAPADLTPRS